MYEFLPILIVGAIIGAFTMVFVIAYIAIGKVKNENNKERTMSDKELIKRLLAYAKPYWIPGVRYNNTPTVYSTPEPHDIGEQRAPNRRKI